MGGLDRLCHHRWLGPIVTLTDQVISPPCTWTLYEEDGKAAPPLFPHCQRKKRSASAKVATIQSTRMSSGRAAAVSGSPWL